jgi:N-acetylglucosamine-6-sulfatase
MYVAPTAPHRPATPADRHEGALSDEASLRPPSFNEEDVSDKPSWIRDLDRISDQQAFIIDAYHRQRLRSMLAVDEMVASLIEELEAAGELENTFIFFTSDNGFQQGEHRIGHGKRTPYEECVRLPLFVRGPRVAPGSRVEKLTLNTDFAPTFAELAGVEFPADGRPLGPLLGGDEETPSWRTATLIEAFTNEEAQGVQANLPSYYQAVRAETHKYVEYENGERELYNLKADPYELESLHENADPSLLHNLKTKLDTLKSCAGEGCREAENAP